MELKLDPKVEAWESGAFSLKRELERLLAVRAAGANEAVVLYAVRVLDALVREAVQASGEHVADDLFGNLEGLRRLNQMGHGRVVTAHALRRLGLDAVEPRRVLAQADAEVAVSLLNSTLAWFFVECPSGPRWAQVSTMPEVQAFRVAREHDAVQIAREVAAGELGAEGVPLQTPCVPALVVEAMIERRAYPVSGALLTRAMEAFPNDLRLNQLAVMQLRLAGRFDKAKGLVGRLMRRYRNDLETMRLAAGIYRRAWMVDRGDLPSLDRALRICDRGWAASGRGIAYFGITAATCAVLLGHQQRSRELAREVRDLCLNRLRRVGLDLGEELALAEAQLLLGELARAGYLYRRIEERHPQGGVHVEKARERADEILQALEVPRTSLDLPARRSGSEEIVVGVAFRGHESMEAPELKTALRSVLSRIRTELPGHRVVVVSAAGEGPDALLAEAGIGSGCALKLVLPMDPEDYRATFGNPSHAHRLRACIGVAEEVIVADPPVDAHRSPREEEMARFTLCGRQIAERADVLVGVYSNGDEPELVSWARNQGRAVARVDPEGRDEPAWERFPPA